MRWWRRQRDEDLERELLADLELEAANTAIFSAVSAALLRPLPYLEPERLVSVSDTVQDWKRQNKVFADLAAYQGDSYNVVHGSGVDHVRAWNISAEFFRTELRDLAALVWW